MHEPVGPALLVWLETTAVAAAMRQWLWLYPTVEVVHILGLAALVGGAVLFDLRLLGVARALPVTRLARLLLGAARWSLVLIVPSGLLMFAAHATEMWDNPAFRAKLVLIAAAGANAWAFHRFTMPGAAAWDAGAPTPPAARAAGLASLVLWIGVVTCGRLLAYL
ncbi:MAG TPA: DUF6644 family protein [Thermodesulfobacteriota bacterium]